LVDDPRDGTAYRMAIMLLGLALVASVVGVCWVVAEHQCPRNIPEAIWFVPAAVGGVFVGALIPFSAHKREDPNSHESRLVCAKEAIVGAALLAAAAVATGVVGAAVDHLLALCGVGTALGGVFFGLFMPSPARRDP
jgi:hypothetical protein